MSDTKNVVAFNEALLLLVVGIGERAMRTVAASIKHELEAIPETFVFGELGMPNAWAELCRDVRDDRTGRAGEAWVRELHYRLLMRLRLLHEDERQCATFAATYRSGNAVRDLVEPFRSDERTLVQEALVTLLDMMDPDPTRRA